MFPRATTVAAVLILGMKAPAVQGQTARTLALYGVLDTNFGQSQAHDGSRTTGLDTVSSIRGPRFGLRGTEALPGGVKTLFQFEAGLSPASGTNSGGSQLFNRQAWVGLALDLGEITLGRQETLHRVLNQGHFNDVSNEDELSVATANSGLQMMQNFGTRVSQAVRYTTPLRAGWRLRLQSALGHGMTAHTNGALLSWEATDLRVALAHEYHDGAGVPGMSRWNQVTTLSTQIGLANRSTVALGWQTTNRLLTSVSAAPAASVALPDHQAFNLGLIWPVGPALTLRAQYTASRTDFGTTGAVGSTRRHYSRLGVSARYALSARTVAYAAGHERRVDQPSAADNRGAWGVGLSHSF